LAVDDDIPIERGGVEVVGDERREDTVGAERDLAVVGGHGHVYLGYELGGAEDLADAEVLEHPVIEAAAVYEVPVVVTAGAVLRSLAAEHRGDHADAVLLRGG